LHTKTGLLDDVSHDAGILSMDGQNYIVAVLTDGWLNATDDATPVFEEIRIGRNDLLVCTIVIKI